MIELRRISSQYQDFQSLVLLLDKDLSVRDGEDHSFYAQFNKIDKIVAYENTCPIGCGAIKKYDEVTAEIKQMFVKSEFRGFGIATKTLSALEEWLTNWAINIVLLRQVISNQRQLPLYRKSGYQIIPNYGQYEGIENSVCMKKSLHP